MRLFAAAMISLCLLGGMSIYIHLQAQWRPPAPVFEPPAAPGVYSLEVTPSFSAAKDPFALDVGDVADGSAILVVKLGKQTLLAKSDTVEAGSVIHVESVAGIQVGKNQFHLSVAVPENQLTVSHAVRIRILRDGVQVADQTLWSELGQPVSGEVTLDVAPPEEVDSSHDHD
jgi:hypothetical protein